MKVNDIGSQHTDYTSLLQVSNISCCNISNNNHVENVLELGESCNHETTKQGLSEVEITSFVPEAVAANLVPVVTSIDGILIS